MTLHLDTNALIWLMQDSERLGKRSRKKILESIARAEVAVSAFVFWELAMLVHKNRIRLSSPVLALRERLLAQGVIEIPVSGDIAIMANHLDNFHADPADRIILATALQQCATLITADTQLLSYRHPQILIHDATL